MDINSLTASLGLDLNGVTDSLDLAGIDLASITDSLLGGASTSASECSVDD